MAPKVSKKLTAAQIAATTSPSAASTSGAEEPTKVNLYDAASLKSTLDDCAHEVVVEAGYDEDHSVSTTKIILGLSAIGCALYAQFGPGKFPANWWMVFYCVAAYSVLTGILNLHAWLVEAGAILICKPRRGATLGLRMSSRMERFDDKYTIYIYLGTKGKPNYRAVETTTSVAKFFHANGYLCKTAFKPVVEQLLQDFEQKKNS